MLKKTLTLSLSLALFVVASNASASYIAQPGDLLRTMDDATVVLVMDNGSRMPISADGYALRYNNNFGLVKVVTAGERGSYSSDMIINNATSLTSGTVFMYEVNQPGFFVIENGFKRMFSTWTGFEAAGHNLKDVEWIGLYTQYPTGTPVQ
jgi:hypothetical protein